MTDKQLRRLIRELFNTEPQLMNQSVFVMNNSIEVALKIAAEMGLLTTDTNMQSTVDDPYNGIDRN